MYKNMNIGQIIFWSVVLFLLGILLEYKQVSIECTSKYNYCNIITTNIFKISIYEKFFIPNDIEEIRTDSYTHGRHNHTSYKLNFVSKNEDVRDVKHLGSYEETDQLRKQLMNCFKSEKYPCVVDARGY